MFTQTYARRRRYISNVTAPHRSNEADEGRMVPGRGRHALVFVYNRMMLPIICDVNRRAEKTDREYRRDRSTAARPPRRRPAATRHSGTKTMTFLSDVEGATRTLALIEKMPHAVGMRLSSKEDRPVRSLQAMCSPRSASHRSKRMAIPSGRRSQWKPPTRLRR